jgi:hypothetical protein
VCHYQRRWLADSHCDCYSDCYRYSHRNCCGDSDSNGNGNTDGDRCAQDNADAKAASDTTASSLVR